MVLTPLSRANRWTPVEASGALTIGKIQIVTEQTIPTLGHVPLGTQDPLGCCQATSIASGALHEVAAPPAVCFKARHQGPLEHHEKWSALTKVFLRTIFFPPPDMLLIKDTKKGLLSQSYRVKSMEGQPVKMFQVLRVWQIHFNAQLRSRESLHCWAFGKCSQSHSHLKNSTSSHSKQNCQRGENSARQRKIKSCCPTPFQAQHKGNRYTLNPALFHFPRPNFSSRWPKPLGQT